MLGISDALFQQITSYHASARNSIAGLYELAAAPENSDTKYVASVNYTVVERREIGPLQKTYGESVEFGSTGSGYTIVYNMEDFAKSKQDTMTPSDAFRKLEQQKTRGTK
eukprot:gb/GECG01011463.1/.p1 GENE.gb/GECG01011463.1/~~gb/GECG01011463.1/.p1  ORF type:complete len:110 (+),score=17.34 gb/GECG01011463.1/:1-330(+)